MLTEGALPLMTSTTRRPTILNVSSIMGSSAAALDRSGFGYKMQIPAYAMSKAAMNRMTLYLAAQHEDKRVISVCPGYIATAMNGYGQGAQPASVGGKIIVHHALDFDGSSAVFLGPPGEERQW